MDRDVDEIPPGVPGRVAVCELCGRYVNNFQRTGEMKWCPHCSKPSLRSNCPKCDVDIPVPPQLKCFNCGSWLTLMPMMQTADGTLVPKTIEEPDAKVRKQLESKGSHWHDVVKGRAEGPALKEQKVEGKPPKGWTPQDFEKYLNQTLREHGVLQARPAEPEVYVCDTCQLPQIIWGMELKCYVCGGPVHPDKVENNGDNPQAQ